jgi:hypothetical protein
MQWTDELEARAPGRPGPRNLTIERAVAPIASSRVNTLHQVGHGVAVAVGGVFG